MQPFVMPGGNEIRAYHPGGQPVAPADDAPLTFVMMVTKYQGRYLVLYNPEREQWEIPGGGINPGETPDQTAHRELMEESSQVAGTLTYRGVFKLWLKPDNREEYGALYTVEVGELRDHVPNEESEKIAFFESPDDIPPRLSELSRWMMDTCAGL